MNPKTNMKNVIFFDPYPKGIDDWNQKYQKPHLFMKYFPKYLKNLTTDFKHGAVKSKVKRTKIIHDLKSTEYSEKSSYWQVLLSNKMKSVKTLSNLFQSTIVFLDKIKLFSCLQSIQITPLDGCEGFEHYLRKKANKKMLSLPKLNSLKITAEELVQHYLYLYEDLNSLPKLLKSLQTFTVHFTSPEYQFPDLVEVLKNNPNLLRYMTSFLIGPLSSLEGHQAFKGLANSCQNLRHLSFEFSCRSIYHKREGGKVFSKPRLPTHANCLQVLKTFPNLKSLDLKIADNEAFLSHFALPPGVQWLSLEFEESFTSQQSDGSLQSFEENSAFAKFFESFEHLENLETLKLAFSEDSHPESYEDQNELSQCLLRRLPSLKKFVFAIKNSNVSLNGEYNELPIKDSSLPQLLKSCSQTLETLTIETYEKILYSEYDFSSLQNKFTNLKTIKFKGSFSEDNPKLLGLLLQQLISLGNSITAIEFTVIFGGEEFFLALFDALEKVQIPNQVKIQMKIKPSKNPYGFIYYKYPQEELMNKTKPEQKFHQKFRGISLAIFTYVDSWRMTEFLKSFAYGFDEFKIIYKSRGLRGSSGPQTQLFVK